MQVINKIIIIFILLFSINTFAITNYEKAIQEYKKGNYKSALSLLKGYATKQYKESPKALLVMAKIYIDIHEYRNASFILKLYSEKYAQLYQTEYQFLNALIKIKTNNIYGGLTEFFEVLKKSKNPYYNNEILNYFRTHLVDSLKIQINELHDLYEITKDYPQVNHISLFALIKYYFKTKNYKVVKKFAQTYLQLYKDYQYSELVYNYLKIAETQKEMNNKFAVILPLSGEYAEFGKEILKSIKLVFDNDPNITYEVFDSKSDPVTTINQIKNILNYGDFKGIIGPVTSLNVIAASALVSEHKIPLITPTATEDGIAKIGENIFQINVSIKKLGEKIAQYANDSLKLKNYIIIAPDNAYGKVQATSFQNYIESRGGRIIVTEFYKPGTQDFKEILLSVRKILFIEKLEKENFLHGTKKSYEKLSKKERENTDLYVDGIFLPSSSPEELIMLIPQIWYYRIFGTFLGSSGWYSNMVLKNAAQYINNSYFSIYFYKVDRYPQRIQFEKLFKKTYYYEPSKVAYLGYDAAMLFKNAINSGYRTPEEITYYLQNLSNYKGVSGTINFYGTNGDNNGAIIIKIEKGIFKKINEW